MLSLSQVTSNIAIGLYDIGIREGVFRPGVHLCVGTEAHAKSVQVATNIAS